MEYSELFAALDARPFRPFTLELVSGQKLEVTHPDNFLVCPTRHRVHHFELYWSDPYRMAIIWPEGLVGLLFPAPDAPPAS